MADGTKFSGSLLAGLILLPVSAVVAVALTGILTSPPAPGLPDAGGVTAAASPALPAPPQANLSETDVWQACVPDAAALIVKETDGSITAIEDAALDALRSVCAQEGIPVEGPAAPAPVTETVVVPSSQGAVAATAALAPSPINAVVSYDDDSESQHRPDDDDDRSDDDDSS